MSRKPNFLMLLLLVLGLPAILFTAAPNPEPTFHTRPFTQWIERFAETADDTAEHIEAQQALLYIARNSMPRLLDWLNYDPRPRRLRDAWIEHHLPTWVLQVRPIRNLLSDKKLVRAADAVTALHMLGPEAAPAIPALTHIMSRTNHPAARIRALYLLTSVGPQGIPPLESVITNPTDPLRRRAISQTVYLGTNTRAILPTLIQTLQDPNSQIRAAAAKALETISPTVLTNDPAQ